MALGIPLNTMFAELMGKVTGNALGLGGVLHMVSREYGMVGFSGTLGCDIAVSDGAALSIQMAGTDNVSYVFYGDGTSNRGPVHEAMNLAAVWKLPVLFVCNNNQFAISTFAKDGVSVPHPGADRAAAYGMPTRAVDGTDVLAVYEAAKELVDGIRAGGRRRCWTAPPIAGGATSKATRPSTGIRPSPRSGRRIRTAWRRWNSACRIRAL